ncbi:tyrosine-protein phosphatase [Microlunatus speluncae]|uniref:tyrosine-protein phosphatase n=1 Tax=Microlunatus speluncae TaxID=2594267 RepID=UPI0013754428|nr:tyrosine-protein phosphatase [Microlunatus speluncae]
MAKHRADWDGARNLADLGGLPLQDGGCTRSGAVWCSAAPEWLTTEGWRAARVAGLTRVVDLRNDRERGRRPEHPIVDATVKAGIEVVHAPTEDPTDPEFLAECGPWLDHPKSWAPNLARYPAKFARVFTAIAEADGPVLVHCAGGRDRTGMVCSVLLNLVGATPEAIADNYERGFRGAAAHRGHGMAYDQTSGEWITGPSGPARTAAELDRMIADRRPALLDWVRTFDVTGYLTAVGVDPVRLARTLRDRSIKGS